MGRLGVALSAALVALTGPSVVSGQTVSTAASQATNPAAQTTSQPPAGETVDVMDLLRKLRGKELTAEQQAAALDPRARMRAAAPIIGYKPSSGVLIGVAGNLAFFRGDPATTNISSNVVSFTFSSKKQISLMARSHVFGGDNRWALDGDHRAQWTSLDTYGLGTSTTTESAVNLEFDYFRVYDTAYVKVRRNLHAGLGFHLSAHTSIGPGDDADEAWDTSPFVTYSTANGFPLDSQTSAGTSLNLRFDSRDSGINPGRGWLASVNYRPFFKGFLGGDSSWQELYLDVRTYRALDATGRHKLAFWVWGDAVAGGVAPYLDLPATAAMPRDDSGESGCSTERSSTAARSPAMAFSGWSPS